MSRRLLVAVAASVALSVLPRVTAAQEMPSEDTPTVRALDFSGALVNTTVPPILLGAAQLPSLQRPVTFERPSNRPSARMLAL